MGTHNRKYFPEIFKANDIRGIVETALTPDVVEDIGKVLGTMALELQQTRIVVGYDGRLSSPQLAKSLITGILSSGCNVYDIGEVTTPMVYFATFFLKTGSGVMITGSHNPIEYNGLKMVLANETLSATRIQEIRQRLEEGNYTHDQQGACENADISEEYIQQITDSIKLKRKINIIVDAGNGVAGKIAPKLYRRMGAKVLGLFCDVDGTFPHHHPDPSQPENLKALIAALKSTEAEFGIAFDGDGDRLGVVTKDGNIIYPDRQLMLFAADVLDKHPQAKVIYDVKSSGLLADWIKSHGGEPIISRTGHSFIKAKIKETGALLAGELSGHLFFNDRWNGTDDGVYAGARLLEILAQVDDPSAVLNALPNAVATPEINVAVAEGEQHKIVEKLQKTAKFPENEKIITIDGLRVEYPFGFGLVRASNTSPVLVLRFEAESNEKLEWIKEQFRSILLKHVNEVTF